MPRRRSAALALLGLALATPAAARPVALRGVIEGYYGRPWSGDARRDVIAFLGAHGLNTFVYAPKNDDFHRARWREPYPADALADLARTAHAARRARVAFVYALSPVLDVCYSCADDFAALTAKLGQLAGARIRRFTLLFDDGGVVQTPEDQTRYGGTDLAALARAQADLVNRVQDWLRRHRRGRVVLMVPTEYAGIACEPYHAALAPALARGLPVAWTGPGVFADAITGAMARARAACLPGHPVVLWDNFPVNDTVVSNSLHLGPLTGRDAALPAALHGYLLNPMTQPHASLVALGTAAAYLRRPDRYDAEAAWHTILAELGGGGSGLGVLAAQVRSSALDLDDARELAAAVAGVLTTFPGPDWTAAVDALAAEEARQASVPGDLAAHLGGTPLAAEIAPWVDELAAHVARGLDAVTLLRALKPSLTDLITTSGAGMLRVHGRALPPDASAATALGPGFGTEASASATRIATPPTLAYLMCLGLERLTSADIGFCPQYGLNVHGKSFYWLIRSASDITIVTDRNVHDHLVTLAAVAYETWRSRRGPGSDALALTLDGAPVPLATDGTFDATVAATSATLRLATAAGEATARALP
jgi:hypothetical protein